MLIAYVGSDSIIYHIDISISEHEWRVRIDEDKDRLCN